MRFRLDRIKRGVGAYLLRPGDNGDGYPAYVRAAKEAGFDVNDWIEKELGWIPARPVLEDLVFPLLRPDSTVCEVGIGTGRWARQIATHIPNGRLALVDRSSWVVEFCRGYFSNTPQVDVHLCDGASLPFRESSWADLVFSQGMIITLKLGHIMLYLHEFARVLKPGGSAVLDFIDPETPEGWAFLEREYRVSHDVFAFHTQSSIAKCLSAAGFEVSHFRNVGKSTYVVARIEKNGG